MAPGPQIVDTDDLRRRGVHTWFPNLEALAGTLQRRLKSSYQRLVYWQSKPGWSITLKAYSTEKKTDVVRLTRSNDDAAVTSSGLERQPGDFVERYSKATEIEVDGDPLRLTVRRWASAVLSGSSIYGRPAEWIYAPRLTRNQGARRARIIRDVTRGAVGLHERDRLHKDIRPANIWVRSEGARLLDWGLPTPSDLLDFQQRTFVAPEVLAGGDRSKASDVYAIGRLLSDLLLDHLDIDDHVPLSRLDARRLHWVVERALSHNPQDRPGIEELEWALFAEEDWPARRAIQLLGEAKELFVHELADYVEAESELTVFTELAQAAVEFHLRDLPETALGIVDLDRAKAALALAPVEDVEISTSPRHAEIHPHDDGTVAAEYVGLSEPSIDEEWRRNIALDYVPEGTPGNSIDVDRLLGELTPEHRELLEDDLAFAERVRRRLVTSDHFFDEVGLARLMSRPGLEITPGDVALQRAWGQLISVRDHGRWIYPHFQFDPETGQPYSAVAAVADRVPSDESPWALLSWWMTENPIADGRRPMDLLGQGMDELLLTSIDDAVTPA